MNKFNVFLLSALIVVATMGFAVAIPNGASTVTSISNSTAGATSPESHGAYAGNVTEIEVFGESVTQSWQGYYGNITGSITLENAAGNVLYNWSLASPQGELFASNASSITWSSIACYPNASNFDGFEAFFNVPVNSEDGVNKTFLPGNDHEAFAVGGTSFTAGVCDTAFVFDSTGTGVDNNFEEVLLWDTSVHVFAALLEEDLAGFDGASHDFEMLVLEDGHSGDTTVTPYYFYVELE